MMRGKFRHRRLCFPLSLNEIEVNCVAAAVDFFFQRCLAAIPRRQLLQNLARLATQEHQFVCGDTTSPLRQSRNQLDWEELDDGKEEKSKVSFPLSRDRYPTADGYQCRGSGVSLLRQGVCGRTRYGTRRGDVNHRIDLGASLQIRSGGFQPPLDDLEIAGRRGGWKPPPPNSAAMQRFPVSQRWRVFRVGVGSGVEHAGWLNSSEYGRFHFRPSNALGLLGPNDAHCQG